MGRRPESDFDVLMDSWARWCVSGPAGMPVSMLGKLIDCQGVLIQGSGGGSGVPLDCIEARIDSLVAELSLSNMLAADVLRLEYHAGYRGVLKRFNIRTYDRHGSSREMRAAALGISERTYRRRLEFARAAVMQGLAGKKLEEDL